LFPIQPVKKLNEEPGILRIPLLNNHSACKNSLRLHICQLYSLKNRSNQVI